MRHAVGTLAYMYTALQATAGLTCTPSVYPISSRRSPAVASFATSRKKLQDVSLYAAQNMSASSLS